jgi:TP901-1 family phage major tail protein
MAAQSANALLIKIGDGGGTEVFTDFAGLRTKSLTINSDAVDITNSDSTGRWREILDGAGVNSISVSGSGVFLDDATADADLRDNAMTGTVTNFQIIVPDFGTFQGPFKITSTAWSGDNQAEVTYDVSLESAGQIAFTAA